MAWTTYAYTDASAPAMTGVAGSLVTLLDAVLVNGYGAKAAAGWTKEYSGTNKAAYRMGSGRTKYYLQILDNAPGASGAREARMQGYETMTTVDAGGNVVGPAATPGFIRKSSTLDSTARPWYCVADDRTFILYQSWDSSTTYSPTYYGEFLSYMPNDDHAVCAIHRHTENVSSWTISAEAMHAVDANQNTITIIGGHHIARDVTTSIKGAYFSKSIGMGANLTTGLVGTYTFPTPSGGLLLAPLYVRHADVTGLPVLRGRLRGVWCPLHNSLTPTVADTFSGTGDLAGKTFMYIGYGAGGTSNQIGYNVVEISDTVARN